MLKSIKKYRVLLEAISGIKDIDIEKSFLDIETHLDTHHSNKKDEVINLLRKCRAILENN